jgi:hypothetical protein
LDGLDGSDVADTRHLRSLTPLDLIHANLLRFSENEEERHLPVNDSQLVAETILGGAVLATPLILLMWFWGHRTALKRLANGESVIQRPRKHEQVTQVQLRAFPVILRSKSGPIIYLGATASAGMLRRWSIGMAIGCGVAAFAPLIPYADRWYGGLGYICLLYGFLYLADLKLVGGDIRPSVRLFIVAYMPVGAGLFLSFARLVGWLPSCFAWAISVGAVISGMLFARVACIRVSKSDIVYQIRHWKNREKHKESNLFFDR